MKLVQNLILLVCLLSTALGNRNGNGNQHHNKHKQEQHHKEKDNDPIKRSGNNGNGKGRKKGCLYQADFDAGTVIISKPGNYRLCENISFRPNFPVDMTDDAFEDLFDPDLDVYSPNAFGLGSFSAIAIEADDVTIDLNGFTLEQSAEHALLQRFFALIELASAPFIKNVGPSQFVGEKEKFGFATNVRIVGPGTLGRSSHHGIHGNQNRGVTIRNVDFRDFEVAAVSLNNVDGLKIQNCNILHNRWDVPVIGAFSSARFIRPYLKKLIENGYSMFIRGEEVPASKVYDDVITAIRNVYDDVMEKGFIDPSIHPEEHRLFDNPKRVVDGPCYGFLVHGMGPAVADFGYWLSSNSSETSSDIVISNNNINNLTCWNDEVPAAIEGNRVVTDVRGAVLQFEKTFGSAEHLLLANKDGSYKGNVVADAQIMVANAILEKNITHSDALQIGGVNHINQNIIFWAMGVAEEEKVYTPRFRCNGDSMHHVIKGVTAIRVDKVRGFTIRQNNIQNITNLSEKAFGNCYDYHSTSPENMGEQQLGNVRGISVAAVSGYGEDGSSKPKQKRLDSKIQNNKVIGVSSLHPNKIIGIDCQGISNELMIVGNVVDLDVDGTSQVPKEKMIGLRLRSKVTDCTERGNVLKNGMVQEVEETGNVRRRVEALPGGLPSGHGLIEWEHGETPGCPFARMQNAK